MRDRVFMIGFEFSRSQRVLAEADVKSAADWIDIRRSVPVKPQPWFENVLLQITACHFGPG